VASEDSIGSKPGRVVAGKYRIDGVLGEGGMGVVVAATHEQLDQRFALKFLLPVLAKQPELVQRFMREARAAAKIQSEHVARVMDVGLHQGAPFMVMEYLEGADLAQLLADRGPVPPGDAVGYLLEAGEAIAEAHALGIVHRDLKPANLFLANRPNGKPIIKVLDFGISKASTGNDTKLTGGSGIVGSPSYMSPEQLVAASSVDARSDIWSLGVVLYEMLSSKLPFNASTMPELVGVILQKAPEPLAMVRPDLPPALVAVVGRCLEKEPGRRYANVAQLADALLPFAPPSSQPLVERIRHVLDEAPPSAPSPPAPTHSADALAATKTFSPMTSNARHRGRRRLLIAGPALVVLCAAGLFFVARGLKRPPPLSDAPPAAAPVAATSPPEAPTSSPIGAPPSTGVSPMPSASAGATPAAPSEPQPQRAKGMKGATRSSIPAQGLPSARAPSTPAPPDAGPTCRLVPHVYANGDTTYTKECP
jgi:serine/threonine protein kinase